MKLSAAVTLISFLAILLNACSDGDVGGGNSPTALPMVTSASEPSPTPLPGADGPTGATAPAGNAGVAPSPAPQTVTGIPTVSFERVFPNLGFETMTGMYQAQDGRWFVTEKAGRVSAIDAAGQATLFLDLTGPVNPEGNEEGLLGMALAPDFDDSGVFYLYYSAANPRRSVISRFIETPFAEDTARTEQVLLEIGQPFANHNGGQIVFGPDGYLYIGLGDGGSARDPAGNGQDLATLLGDVLRIDVAGGQGYSVPAGNPYVGQPYARPEIWASGLRNPWRFSFDSATGELWLGDVGQASREEIDLVVKGANYGWNIMEGFECLGGGSNCNTDGLTLPVFDYASSSPHCSVTGGFVYRGEAVPALSGAYVFADYCSGHVWALRKDGTQMTEQGLIAEAGFPISSFAQGNDGELYVLEYDGAGGIYRIIE